MSVDSITKSDWMEIVGQFADANVYQTWAYGACRWGDKSLSHIVLYHGGRPVAAAQSRLIGITSIGLGLCYVGYGPMWQRHGAVPDTAIYSRALEAIRTEYGERRGLAVRVSPSIFVPIENPGRSVNVPVGYSFAPGRQMTIHLDLAPTLVELRAGLRRRWRQTLDKAEKTDLVIEEGTDVRLYDEALTVYAEMHQRKQFAEFVDKEQFRRMQMELPEEQRMRILVCRVGVQPVAAIAWGTIGDTGLPLLAATGAKALENDAAYVMWWRMIEWLHQHGFKRCDLGGINQERNPGGYIFKSGIGKTHGTEVVRIGEFECCPTWRSRLVAGALRTTKAGLHAAKLRIERIRHRAAKDEKQQRDMASAANEGLGSNGQGPGRTASVRNSSGPAPTEGVR